MWLLQTSVMPPHDIVSNLYEHPEIFFPIFTGEPGRLEKYWVENQDLYKSLGMGSSETWHFEVCFLFGFFKYVYIYIYINLDFSDIYMYLNMHLYFHSLVYYVKMCLHMSLLTPSLYATNISGYIYLYPVEDIRGWSGRTGPLWDVHCFACSFSQLLNAGQQIANLC